MDFTPGCFGSVLAHDLETPECQKCSFAAECGVKAAETESYLKKELGISELPRIRKKSTRGPKPKKKLEPELQQPQPREEQGISKKSADTLSKVLRLRVNVLEALKKGVNPFAQDGFLFLRIACNMLLDGGFTRAQLRSVYMNQFGWTLGTAAAQVSIACAVLPRLGIQEQAGRFFIQTDIGQMTAEAAS